MYIFRACFGVLVSSNIAKKPYGPITTIYKFKFVNNALKSGLVISFIPGGRLTVTIDLQ